MISSFTNLIDRDAGPFPTRPKATAGRLLSLAAAPTFAVMALLTVALGGEVPAMLCSAGHHMSTLGGMGAMYLLMSVFHLRPWLALLPSQQGVIHDC